MSDLWTTLDADLGEPLQDFALAGDRSCLVNLRYQGAVLGQFVVTPSDLPLSREELGEMAARAAGPAAAWLVDLGRNDLTIPELSARTGRTPRCGSGDELFSRLGDALASRRSRPVTVSASIIIHAAGWKPSVLRAILAVIRPDLRGGHEAIVIHDDGDAKTAAVLADHADVRVVNVRGGSIEAARQAGLRAARGEVAVFLGEGVIPEPGWLDPLLQGFDAAEVGAVFGMVLPARNERADVIQGHFSRYHSYARSLPMRFGPEFVRGWRWGVPLWETGGCSVMAVRRAAALSCRRLFHDCSWRPSVWKDLLAAGWIIRYEPLSLARRSSASMEGSDPLGCSRGRGGLLRHMLAYRRRGTRYELPHVDLLPPWRPARRGLDSLLRRAP